MYRPGCTYIEHAENYGEISNGQGRWRRIALIAIDLVPLASLHFSCTLFFIDSIGNHINKSMANGAPVRARRPGNFVFTVFCRENGENAKRSTQSPAALSNHIQTLLEISAVREFDR
jgi:hypothetical protein